MEEVKPEEPPAAGEGEEEGPSDSDINDLGNE